MDFMSTLRFCIVLSISVKCKTDWRKAWKNARQSNVEIYHQKSYNAKKCSTSSYVQKLPNQENAGNDMLPVIVRIFKTNIMIVIIWWLLHFILVLVLLGTVFNYFYKRYLNLCNLTPSSVEPPSGFSEYFSEKREFTLRIIMAWKIVGGKWRVGEHTIRIN